MVAIEQIGRLRESFFIVIGNSGCGGMGLGYSALVQIRAHGVELLIRTFKAVMVGRGLS